MSKSPQLIAHQYRGRRFHEAPCLYRLRVVHRKMIERCYYPRHVYFASYGGRGITVCDEWRNSVDAFIAWSLDHGWDFGVHLDRIDNDAGYSPGNCQFLTVSANRSKAIIDRRARKEARP